MGIPENRKEGGDIKVVDMHYGTTAKIYRDCRKGGGWPILENQMILDSKKIQAGDYGLQNFALYVSLEQTKGRPFEFCMEFLDTFCQEVEVHGDIIVIVRSYGDISRNWEQGRMSALLIVEEGGTCQGEAAFLRGFCRLDVHMMTLTWDFLNEPAFPNARIVEEDDTFKMVPDTGYRLTDTGIAFVGEMERLGVIIDIPRLSDVGTRDVSRHTKNPFMTDHSNARAMVPHPKNLTDDMICVLAERGGIMGINYCTTLLQDFGPGGEQLSRISDVMERMKHIRKVGGIGHIRLGSDFDGISGDLEMGDAGRLPMLAYVMEREDPTFLEIEAVFCKNVLRVYKEILQWKKLYTSSTFLRGGFYFGLVCCLYRLYAGKGDSWKMKRTYIIGDGEDITNLLKTTLEGSGCATEGSGVVGENLARTRKEKPDLVVFDRVFPGMDGIGAIEEVGNTEQLKYVPIMLLTAKERELDKVIGLGCGADDYMIRPFGVLELSARIRSLSRRAKREENRDILFCQDIQISRKTGGVSSGGRLAELTLKEFELLVYLLEGQSRVVARDKLLSRIWGYEHDGETRTLDIHIHALRQKLGEGGGACIKTVRGVGYHMVR